MSLAKGESSSHRKGNEVATDDPLVKTVGGEAPHSESGCSDKEEGGRNPSIEGLPLIDLWYDTHIHFPIVSSDYSPPPLGHVWLPFTATISKSLGPLWRPLFPNLISAKGPHYPCPFSLNLGRVRYRVEKNGWTRSCPM